MKVVLYMAISADGFIATKNGETPWSEKEWLSFSRTVKKYKNIVIGRNTYEHMKQSNDFAKINNPYTVVVTSQTIKNSPNTIFVNSPKSALEVLKKKGVKTALIAGGGKVNTSFLKECLIDEIILDVEPFIFGQGIKVFDTVSDVRLELLSTKKLSKNEIQLRYKVKE